MEQQQLLQNHWTQCEGEANENSAGIDTPLRCFTVRRNPHRRARQQTPAVTNGPDWSVLSPAFPSAPIPFLIDEVPELEQPPFPPSAPKPEADQCSSENLRVFLRIRPLETKSRQHPGNAGGNGKPRGKGFPPKAEEKAIKKKKKKNEVCLVANGTGSVMLAAPPSLIDRRAKSEIYDGFSYVFPPESLQNEVYEKVMGPLVMDFMDGKSGLLAAMGPTGSGKTQTMFGCPRDPGMLPLALQQIFCNDSVSGTSHMQRSYYLSMFEICSERGKAERIFDLSPGGVDLATQRSSIKGVQEVKVSNVVEAECLLARGTLKRCTAATNANDQSSRSQFIFTIRHAPYTTSSENQSSTSALLTIVDLAGAERERRTGNQGTRLSESNFINNTSMVFGLCLRSLLEHQKNPKKPLQKHYQNSLLTRYLRDYLEGRKRMTLILTAKPGEDDYLDTSFLLRQASPYMKIKFNKVEESLNAPSQKRCVVSLGRQELPKRRRYNDTEALSVDGMKSCKNVPPVHKKEVVTEQSQDFEPHPILVSCSEPSKISKASPSEEYYVELQRLKRNDHIMQGFSKALWKVLRQYKQKLEASEDEVQRLKESLRKEETQVMLLEKELTDLRCCCSFQENSSIAAPSTPEGIQSKLRPTGMVPSTGNKSKKVKGGSDNLTQVMEQKSNEPPNVKPVPACLENLNFDVIGLSSTANLGHNKLVDSVSIERVILHLEETKFIDPCSPSSKGRQYGHADLHGGESSGKTDLHSPIPLEDVGSLSSTPVPAHTLLKEGEETSDSPHFPEKLETNNQLFSAAEDAIDIDKLPIKKIPLKENNTASRSLDVAKPRRRLLPASAMLLKEFSGLDVETENVKGGAGAEKKEPIYGRQRSEGSISLVRMLKSSRHW